MSAPPIQKIDQRPLIEREKRMIIAFFLLISDRRLIEFANHRED